MCQSMTIHKSGNVWIVSRLGEPVYFSTIYAKAIAVLEYLGGTRQECGKVIH
jgi:hypothetical protein